MGEVIPYCDEVNFYDNENGFIKVAEIKNGQFRYINGYRQNGFRNYVITVRKINCYFNKNTFHKG